MHAGGQADFVVVAKDGKGVRKSLGGDTFALSWTRAGADEPPHAGRVSPLSRAKHCTASLSAGTLLLLGWNKPQHL